MSLFLALFLAAGTDAAPEAPEGRRTARFLADVGVAATASATIALVKPDLRRALFRDASLSSVLENFAHPIRQVRIGTRRDSDPFWVNDVAHPGLFALEALYLKHRGYRDRSAFAFTQVHSVLWEFAIEGSAFEPSGKDLIADAAGAAAGLWILRPLAGRASRRLAEGRGKWWDHGVRWLDPVERLTGGKPAVITITPLLGRGGVGLAFRAGF